MLDFLRLLAPNHTDALRPASALRRPAAGDTQPLEPAPSLDAIGPELMPPLHTAPRPRAEDTEIASLAMPTPSQSGTPDRAHHMLPSPSRMDVPARVQRTDPPISDSPMSPDIRADASDATPAMLHAEVSRQPTPTAATAPATPYTRPADSTQGFVRSDATSDRVDRTATRDRAATSKAPLSPTTVALYAAPSDERDATPPAIHVTIDRIEVRAPTKDHRPAPAKRREATATQTLGDYLRGHAKVTR